MKRSALLISMVVALALAGPGAAYAQATYPTKSIRIVTAPPGGSNDFSARIVAQGLSNSFGQQVIVDNRGGGSGIIIAEIVAKAPADGYTLLLTDSKLWLLPFLQDNVPYDPVKDFAPITQPDKSPIVLVVHPSLPVKSVRELISLAKAKPGKLNYARQSAGTQPHLSAELFKVMAGVNIVPVPYKGAGPVVLAILAGEVEVGFVGITSGGGAIKSKRLRALAVSTLKRSPVFPDLPTVDESGVPGFESVQINAIFAPARTPASVINRLHQEIVQVLRLPEVKARFLSTGMEPVGTSPEELASLIKSDMPKWGKLIKSVGLRAD